MPDSFGNLNELFKLDSVNIDTDQSVPKLKIFTVSDKTGKNKTNPNIYYF